MSKFIDLSYHNRKVYDYEIIPNALEKGNVLITLPELIKIEIIDFTPNKILQSLLNTEDDFVNLSVSYPLKSCSFLQVITLSKTEEDTTTVQGIIWLGSDFSAQIPYIFAQKLQNFLLTGELTNE